MIYFDNAATSLPKPPQVAEAVAKAINSFGGAGRGAHPASVEAGLCAYRTREALARLFGCSSVSRVAFTANATESLNLAIGGLLRPGDHAITTAMEHNSVLRPLYRLQEQAGLELSILPADRRGCINYQELEGLFRPNTKAVVCTHASNLTGNLVAVAEIGRLCRRRGVTFIVDAAQTAGVFPINMQEDCIDILCFSGHKGLLGPQGTGGICLGDGVELAPLKVGGSGSHSYDTHHPAELPDHLEAGTLNAHGLAGLLAGVEYIEGTGQETIRRRAQGLAQRFYEGVRGVGGITVYGNFDSPERSPVVTLNFAGMEAATVSDLLVQDYDIYTRAGAHCAPLMHCALGTQESGAVRFSFSHFNTEAEVDAGIRAVEELAEGAEG